MYCVTIFVVAAWIDLNAVCHESTDKKMAAAPPWSIQMASAHPLKSSVTFFNTSIVVIVFYDQS